MGGCEPLSCARGTINLELASTGKINGHRFRQTTIWDQSCFLTVARETGLGSYSA